MSMSPDFDPRVDPLRAFKELIEACEGMFVPPGDLEWRVKLDRARRALTKLREGR